MYATGNLFKKIFNMLSIYETLLHANDGGTVRSFFQSPPNPQQVPAITNPSSQLFLQLFFSL